MGRLRLNSSGRLSAALRNCQSLIIRGKTIHTTTHAIAFVDLLHGRTDTKRIRLVGHTNHGRTTATKPSGIGPDMTARLDTFVPEMD